MFGRREGRGERWQDQGEREHPAARRRWRSARAAAEDPDDVWHDRHDDWDEPSDEAYPDDDADEGWRDPERGRRRGFRRRLLLLPLALVLLPFRIAFWFGAISLLWVAAYAAVDPPVWTHLSAEKARLGEVAQDWRDIEAFPPDLIRAVMAAEDARFCDHWGIDVAATRAALRETMSGARLIGGSTITQQVAKNVFLWHGRSWLRKALEAGFAVSIEALWSKRRIMEVYLNVAEFDTGTFGAEAAARGYFGKPASELTLDQAARLAAVLPDPRDRSAAAPGDFTRRRAAAIADGARTLQASGRDACVLR